MGDTNIQWASKTWNPTTGCDKVSAECRFCYAERQANLWQKMKNKGYGERGFNFTTRPKRLEIPKDKNWTGEYVFVGSMSDLFHERCEDDYIHRVFEVMHDVEGNVWQLLTKRPERYVEMDPYLPWDENIWAGTSVGHRDSKDRLDTLRECEASVTYVSFEPLIKDLGELNLKGIDWALLGGESGPIKPDNPDEGIRALDLDWMYQIIDQCREQDTAVFVKQLGEIWASDPDNDTDTRHGGHPYDWPDDLQIREMPWIYPDQPEFDPWP